MFYLRRQNGPVRYFASEGKIDKSVNCLAGHGRASLKKIDVLGPLVVNGLDVASYGRSGPEKSWTVPSLLQTMATSSAYANNSDRHLDLNKIRFSWFHYILQFNFWVGSVSEKLKSLYWYLEKTQCNRMRPTAMITICKYYIKPR